MNARSIWSHRCPAHELECHHGRHMLDASIAYTGMVRPVGKSGIGKDYMDMYYVERRLASVKGRGYERIMYMTLGGGRGVGASLVPSTVLMHR